MKKLFFSAGPALLLYGVLAGCSSQPPVPDWQINAHSAAQRAVQSYLSGQSRSAEREFDQARDQTARTGSPALLARLELLRCAAQAGSTVVEPCRTSSRNLSWKPSLSVWAVPV